MRKAIKIKVCGMKNPQNIETVSHLPVNMLGFIFYPPSKRYIGQLSEDQQQQLLNTSKEKVGVFVDEKIGILTMNIQKFGLDYVQLHGNESPGYAELIRSMGVKIIKAFRVDKSFNFNIVKPYLKVADLFLFDTKTDLPGGSGKKFDWQILSNYQEDIPFLLSGGVCPGDVDQIKKIKHPMFYGVDLNSGFEDKPGLKNIQKLEDFIKTLKQ